MKYNERELAKLGDAKGEVEGRLNYKKVNSSFKERWFKLINNCLFYFRINDVGKIDAKPTGVFFLENASIQIEHGQDAPYGFSISFIDEPEKRHLYSGMSESIVNQWVTKLRSASYEYLRSQLYCLQSKIYLKTGKDPLLLVPRNEGSMKCVLGESFEDNNFLNGATFKSYLIPQNNSTHIVRSKSFVNVIENSKKNQEVRENTWQTQSCGLERSKTSAHVHKRQNPFNSGTDEKEKSSSKFFQSEISSSSNNSFNITSNFQSHLITCESNVQRSKSSVNVHENRFLQRTEKYSENVGSSSSFMISGRTNPFNSHSGRSSPLYLHQRPAPSPPARKKNSPLMTRNIPIDFKSNGHDFVLENSLLHSQVNLDPPPQPPKRRHSPKTVQKDMDNCINKLENLSRDPTVEDSTRISGAVDSEDLIKF